ncbi:rho GTPase-activating protein 22-like [Sardina pilchardus]|uniref:rho GTPase-activating protein 22-like n=1 Tax=Sardina pilchardus TaxID=27697 RepID=UPI002E0F0E57
MGQDCSTLTRNKTQNHQGAGGEKGSAVSHEALLLMANSHTDMDDWVRAIRRVIWAPFGGGIFGQRLEDTVRYERKLGRRAAPLVVEQCVCFIRQRGLTEEGLFRSPGQATLVKELQNAYDRGDKPQFTSNTDVHTVASLLKLYLRELPEPVIPFAKYDDFISCAQLLSKDEEEGVQELLKQVQTLPPANYSLLKYICRFLDEVQSHSSENKMSVQNLATVFGPNILRPQREDPMAIMEGTSLVQHLMTLLISEHERLYPGEGGGEGGGRCPGWEPPRGAERTQGNWLMNGLSSLRGHRRASSGERETRDSARDSSSSSHRLSTYDNVVASCSSLASAGVEGGASGGTSSPWSASSSCEISVSPPDSADHVDTSAVAMEICADVQPEDRVDTAQSLGNLVVGLKEELRRQKTEYEARIQKLEACSAALCSQMERLELEMESERKKQRVLEIKLRNSERARHHAEQRNQLLEQDMDAFFSTLGDARTSDI